MLYLVDGYNVAMADPETRDRSKESMRHALVARLAVCARELLGTGDVVIVFDARDQLGSTSESSGSVRVVYAADADSEIVRRAEKARDQVVIVTNDMRLRARTSQDVGRRVEYRDASTCFEAARHARRGRKRPDGAREPSLPEGADDITEELKKLWLPDGEE